MPAIQIVEAGSIPWMTESGAGEDEDRQLVEVAESEGHGARFPHTGSETEPYLHEAQMLPNTEVKAHAHRSDEIIYVLAGELHLGARVLGPGSSILIPGMTLYGFRSGPTGLRFLNFRGHRDRSHLSKERFLAERGTA